jgi:hypothetical protein
MLKQVQRDKTQVCWHELLGVLSVAEGFPLLDGN